MNKSSENNIVKNQTETHPTAISIIELAETVKELVRIIQSFPNYKKLDPLLKNRLDSVYKKATIAKERVKE